MARFDEDDEPAEKQYPVSPAKMSKTPSWIMLGFVLGALFVVALPPLKETPPARPEVQVKAVEAPAAAPTPRQPPQLTTIEAVFAEWGKHAVWSDDTAEVALWDPQARAFSDFYEVRRIGGVHYFRSIPRLTRRIIAHGKPLPDSPLQFTETEEQYQEWRQHGRTERAVERDFRPQPAVKPVQPRITTEPGATTPPPAVPPQMEPIRPPFDTPKTGDTPVKK